MDITDNTEKTDILNVGNSYFEIKSSYIVRFKDVFTIVTEKDDLYIEVEISADMSTVPEEYREVFMNMLSSKYINKVSFSTNPFCKQNLNKEKPWYKKLFKKWFKR